MVVKKERKKFLNGFIYFMLYKIRFNQLKYFLSKRKYRSHPSAILSTKIMTFSKYLQVNYEFSFRNLENNCIFLHKCKENNLIDGFFSKFFCKWLKTST